MSELKNRRSSLVNIGMVENLDLLVAPVSVSDGDEFHVSLPLFVCSVCSSPRSEERNYGKACWVPNAVKASSHGKQLILRVFSEGQAMVQGGVSRLGRPPNTVGISTRETNRSLASIVSHRIHFARRFIGLCIEAIFWSEFDLWHGVCTCLL